MHHTRHIVKSVRLTGPSSISPRLCVILTLDTFIGFQSRLPQHSGHSILGLHGSAYQNPQYPFRIVRFSSFHNPNFWWFFLLTGWR